MEHFYTHIYNVFTYYGSTQILSYVIPNKCDYCTTKVLTYGHVLTICLIKYICICSNKDNNKQNIFISFRWVSDISDSCLILYSSNLNTFEHFIICWTPKYRITWIKKHFQEHVGLQEEVKGNVYMYFDVFLTVHTDYILPCFKTQYW